MSDKMEHLFAEAVSRLQQGEDIEATLAHYPEHASALRPLLQAVAPLERYQPGQAPAPGAMAAQRQRFLTHAAHLKAISGPLTANQPAGLLGLVASWLSPLLARVALTAATVVLLTLLLSVGAVLASAGSLPGEPLYPLKRFGEQVRIVLTFNPSSRAELEATFARARLEEIRILLARGLLVSVQFEGIVESSDEELWVVSGLTLAINESTVFQGAPRVGDLVRVQAVTQEEGTLLARSIRRAPSGVTISFQGVVDRISSDGSLWTVSSIELRVGSATEVVGTPTLGDSVEVLAQVNGDGSLLVLRIEMIPSEPAADRDRDEECEREEDDDEDREHEDDDERENEDDDEEREHEEDEEREDEDHEDREHEEDDGCKDEEEKEEEREQDKVEFTGTVDSLDPFRVNGTIVVLDDATEIEDNPRVGDTVEVKGWRQEDGSVLAKSIKVKDEDA
ncbi:MAG: hypothetical protein HYZ68_00540 [Chloroflexi bacterium]|nr:hypothetical protein [Chloroflexota bacterium]